MGTYTTNYNLFMPTVGETGWGTLVNGNFTTIDTTMKSLSNRITTVENEVNGALSCTSVTATTGTFSGTVTAKNFVYSTPKIITVTPNSTIITASTIGLCENNNSSKQIFYALPLLPPDYRYSGKFRIKNTSYGRDVTYSLDPSFTSLKTISVGQNNTADISFTNAQCLLIQQPQSSYVTICGCTLSY